MAKRTWLVLVLLVAGALVLWRQSRPEASAALVQWTGIAALVAPPADLTWERVDAYPEVKKAVEGSDPVRLREALQASGLRGLWVGVSAQARTGAHLPLRERLANGAVVRGFRGAVLTTEGLLYVVDETKWPVVISDRVLARVARRVLEGSDPPPMEAFPGELLEEQAVEVLIVLSSGSGPRLWRSARAHSIAEGLVTASLAARERWEERAETMGGPLGERLDQLDIEVAFLFDDGTFAPGATSLIDTLVKPQHGVAYEQPSRWRYLLPRATHRADSPTDAYEELFRVNGLPEDSFERKDLRLYRVRMQTVSIDQGSTGSR
ncbi:MAG: hypothetical protein KJO40_16620 [Deltaproteobacteria bacterium]|nr:hypothetical protein [Deltaproteobacteria bacterium]NNK08447.1 hypothetical protein [Myxococcales bacterium]MBT8466275.1 hypothetical protein [Deltaproteobacteria bacterium]MBT8483578.1 hypothetical protein [Deltaproteobacteria bacterium]NNK43360.1 hypothetical protein [Myxococcales bacterium]